METFGTTLPVFIGLNVVILGFAAYMTGQALAQTWRPMWQLIPYAVLLGAAERFFDYALFGNELLSFLGWVLATAVILVISILAFRLNQARKMVKQYPWLYVRSGPFGWREQ